MDVGSDDALAKDSLAILQTYLDSQADIYLCDRKETGCDLVEIRNPHRSWLRTDDELYVFNNNLDRKSISVDAYLLVVYLAI